MNPEQSAIVWDATLEAAKDMETIRSARGLTPRPFEQRQVDADAAKMVRRFLVKNLDGKIPALEKTKDTASVVVEKMKQAKARGRKRVPPVPKIPPELPEKFKKILPRPKIPRTPKVNWGFILLLAAIAYGGES